ncbi:MAG TPA: SpoIIE family protein phosphatase [Polyangia bacterium]
MIALQLRSPAQRRLDSDLGDARQIQSAMLPPLDQSRDGVEIAAGYRPAYEVGGDFFEVDHLGRGRFSFVVGDVAGKGVSAALIMARVSNEVRRFARTGRRPSRVLGGVNRWLDNQGLSDRFVTATAVQLDLTTGTWLAASAGHPPALLFRRSGEVISLAPGGGPGLGFGGLARWQCEDHAVAVEDDDLLLIVTDGVTDRVDAATLNALIADALPAPGRPAVNLAELRRRIFARTFRNGGEPDDATLLVVRVTPLAARGRC